LTCDSASLSIKVLVLMFKRWYDTLVLMIKVVTLTLETKVLTTYVLIVKVCNIKIEGVKTMEIKPFIEAATANSTELEIMRTNNGYTLQTKALKGAKVVQCTTQKGHIRTWASIDRLVKALDDRRFTGVVSLFVHHQQDLV